MNWLDAIRHTEKTRQRSQKVKGYDAELHDQCLYNVTGALTVGRPTPKVALQVSEALYDVYAVVGACRHDSMRDHIMSLMRLGANGESGVMFAVRELAAAFLGVVTKDGSRSGAEAEREFDRMLNGAGHLLDAGGTGPSAAVMWPSPNAPRDVARRVVAGFAKRPVVFYAQDWFRWDGACYRELGETHLRSELYLMLEDAHHWVKVGKVFEAVPWRPDIGKVTKIVDAMKVRPVLLAKDVRPGRWVTEQGELAAGGEQVIACANGLLRVSDRVLLTPSSRFFNTFALPFWFEANAPAAARWLAFVKEILPGDQEARDLLQEWFGYVVSGRTDLQKALMVIGKTRSGKGTVDRIIRALIGELSHSGLSGSDLTGPFGLEDLIPKTVATFSDERMTMNGKRFVEIFLRITGEDPVTVNQKNKKAWVGRLGTRLQLMSNEFPTLPDNSGAVVGRFLVLYLRESFYGREDHHLDAKLRAELPGILNWALDGLDRLNANGRFTEVTSSETYIAMMREASSPQNLFLEEMCSAGEDLFVPHTPAYKLWEAWCKNNGHDPGTRNNFTKKLQTSALGPGVYNPNTKKTVGGKQVRVYTGFDIKLRGHELSDYIYRAHNKSIRFVP